MTFGDVAERWIKNYLKVEKRETCWAGDEQTIKLHLLPAFGDVLVRDLDRKHLQALKADLKEKHAMRREAPLKASTINVYLALAKTIMLWAQREKIVPVSPFADVKPLKVPKREFDWWTMEECETYLQRGREAREDPELLAAVVVAMNTGLRSGEMQALKGRRLVFGRKKIAVMESFSLKTGKLGPTKTGNLEEVPMNEAVIRALEPLRFSLQPDAFVFTPGLFACLSQKFKRSAERVGCRPIRWHDLRHSFASNLVSRGVPLKDVQELMRHASILQTMRYAHLAPGHLEGATAVLGTLPTHRREAVGQNPS